MATISKVMYKTGPVYQIWDLDRQAAEARVDQEHGITRRARDYGEVLPVTYMDLPIPALEGSEKQIAWAQDIRRARMKEFGQTYPAMDDEAYRQNMIKIFGSRSAKMYIDSRSSMRMFIAARRAELAAAK